MSLLESCDALGMAALVASGDVEAAELLELAIARADRYDPLLNTIVHRFDDRARGVIAAGSATGPFTGVPFLLKDLMHDLAGELTTLGSRGVAYRPEQHSELVRRYLAAGLVPFGKTNTPELGLTITTEPKAHGPVHNPWRRGFSAGGSSGGSAAAVAARIVPVASASDGGGSIRFPAACCGVFGLKPSRGLVPCGPLQGESWNGAVASHVIALSVRDSAALLDATAGPERGAPFPVAVPASGYLAAVQRTPKPMRIGYSSRPMIPAQVHPEAIKGLENTVSLLRELGHQVIEDDPVVDTARLWRDFSTVVFAHTAALVTWAASLAPQAEHRMEPVTLAMARLGRALTGEQLVLAEQGWHQLRMAMGSYLERYDVFLTPTLVAPPQALGVLAPSPLEERLLRIANHLPVSRWLYRSALLEELMMPVLGQMAFTVMANITGLPAMSVPLHWTADGLPLGMQFTGRMGDEGSMLSLAGQLEGALPWFDRRPPLASRP